MFSFYCKLFVMYVLFATVMCYAEVTSVECVNFENEPYCHDAGYMIIKGSSFDDNKFDQVLNPDDTGKMYMWIDPNSSDTEIYAQFAFDKSLVIPGPRDVTIYLNGWIHEWTTISIQNGGWYNSDIPTWTSSHTDMLNNFYIYEQTTNTIKNGSVLSILGHFYKVFPPNVEVQFYCTEPGYTGLMPKCSEVQLNSALLKCTITNAIPTNYTFSYLVYDISDGYYFKVTSQLPPLHIV